MNLRSNRPAARRRGVILLVVLAMLTLFAIAGITFVLYANAASESARISRDAETFSASYADMDPCAAFSFFLNQFIYGVDDNNGPNSALRGHSLAETMYGSYDAVAQHSVGRTIQRHGTPALYECVAGCDQRSRRIQSRQLHLFPNRRFAHDPARYGTRTSPAAALHGPLYRRSESALHLSRFEQYVSGSSDQFLLRARLWQPSYFRSWTGIGGLNPTPNPATNTNWYSPSALKYTTLRPRPAEYGPAPSGPNAFPPPASATGDVKNLVNAPGGNDSIWIDPGAPEMSTSSGLRYKMLVAPSFWTWTTASTSTSPATFWPPAELLLTPAIRVRDRGMSTWARCLLSLKEEEDGGTSLSAPTASRDVTAPTASRAIRPRRRLHFPTSTPRPILTVRRTRRPTQ